MKHATSQRNLVQIKSRRQKIPFSAALGKAIRTELEGRSKEYSQKVKEIRQFTWMLKRAGFKDASGTGAGVDVSIQTRIRGKEVTITADQRVANGKRHGDNAIETRVRQGQLYNKADWIVVINRQKTIEAFPANMLAGFVREQKGSMKFFERRKKYDVFSVRLDDLYRYMKIHHNKEPVRIGLSKDAGKLLIGEMIKEEKKKYPPIKAQTGIPRFTSKKKRLKPPVQRNPTKHLGNNTLRKRFDRKVNPGINQK